VRILTVKQPWAHAIIHGGKHVENRVRNLAGDYRGPLAIHAGLVADTAAQGSPHFNGEFVPREAWATRGQIIGVVNLWAVHQHDGSKHFRCCPNAPDKYQRWAQPGMWHLCFASPRPLANPIPWKGALGMRTLPDEVVEQILKESR
jgi:hypothetical protein